MHRAVVNASVKIGENCILNSQALLEYWIVVQVTATFQLVFC